MMGIDVQAIVGHQLEPGDILHLPERLACLDDELANLLTTLWATGARWWESELGGLRK